MDRRAISRFASALVTFALLGACAAPSGREESPTPTQAPVATTSACADSFAAAAAVDEMHDSVSDLYPAIETCSLDEWREEFARHAGLGFIGTADEVLTNACQAREITDTSLCREIRASISSAAPEPALSLSEIRTADEGDVTLDLLNHPDTVQARFLDAVNDAPFRGTVLGLFFPVGTSDKSLLVYAMDSCSGNPPLPTDWEPAPGLTAVDLNAFAAEVRKIAQQLLCPHL